MKLTDEQRGYIIGYATALQDILRSITGEDMCGKHYDPMTITEDKMISYAYTLKDEGRGHPLSGYNSVDEITKLMHDEVKERFEQDILEVVK